MISQGVNLLLILGVAVVAAAAVAIYQKSEQGPLSPTPSITVAAESTSSPTTMADVSTPIPTVIPTHTPGFPNVLAATSSPTPSPTPTPAKTEGNWIVKDSGKNSNPREAGISYESEDAHVKTNVSTSASGNADQKTHISVTVNGETKTIEN